MTFVDPFVRLQGRALFTLLWIDSYFFVNWIKDSLFLPYRDAIGAGENAWLFGLQESCECTQGLPLVEWICQQGLFLEETAPALGQFQILTVISFSFFWSAI